MPLRLTRLIDLLSRTWPGTTATTMHPTNLCIACKGEEQPGSDSNTLLCRSVRLAAGRCRSTASPSAQDKVDYMIHAFTVFHLRKDRRSALTIRRSAWYNALAATEYSPDLSCVSVHDVQVRANELSEVRLVDDQEVTLGYARPALPWDFVSSTDIYHVYDIVCQLSRVICR